MPGSKTTQSCFSFLDGKSYLPLLKGKRQSGRKYLFTEFTENASGAREPMRARLEKHLKDTSDPVYVPFINRADKGQVEEYMEAQLKLVGKRKNAAREDRLAKEKKMRATSNQ